MKISKIADAIGYIDDDLIAASIDYKPRKIKMKWLPYAATAACAACFCILAVRISGNIPDNDAVISIDSGERSNVTSPVNSQPVSDDSSADPSVIDTDYQDPTVSSGEKPDDSKPENPGNSSGEEPGSSEPEDPTSSAVKPGTPIGDKPAYDDVFKGAGGAFAMGPPLTYDEIADYLTNDPEHPEWDTDSLYLVETICALPIEYCKQLNGWGSDCEGKTIYEVKLLKDLISGETVDRTENILISMGNVEWQDKGDPIYAPGEKFTVVLSKPYEGCDFLRTPAAFAFRYDAIEENGEIMLYSRKRYDSLDGLNMPTSVNIEKTVVTSTTKNPAIYTQKLTLTAFADYLREDFKKRGLTSHFENKPSNDSSETNQDTRNISNTEPNAYLSTKPVTFSTAKEQVKFTEVKEVSGENFVGYELDYVMPSETLWALNYVYTDGEVTVTDNSGDCGVIKISPEYDEKIERDGMVFWKAYLSEPPIVYYISESDVAYIGTFESDADLSKAIDTIKSLI